MSNLVFYGLHRLFGYEPNAPLVNTIAYSLIGTTIAGTIMFLVFEHFSTRGIRKGKRDVFAPRRQTRRRNPIRLGKRT
ncbi:MAG: hypothetical protein ACR2LT_07740 [Pyrinomonadaceae bacterium]